MDRPRRAGFDGRYAESSHGVDVSGSLRPIATTEAGSLFFDCAAEWGSRGRIRRDQSLEHHRHENGVRRRWRRLSSGRPATASAVTLGPSLQLEKRIGEGEAADMAILSRAGAEDLIARGKIVSGSLVDIARSSIGIAVPKGARKPDISSAEGLQARAARGESRSRSASRSAAARAACIWRKCSSDSASPTR